MSCIDSTSAVAGSPRAMAATTPALEAKPAPPPPEARGIVSVSRPASRRAAKLAAGKMPLRSCSGAPCANAVPNAAAASTAGERPSPKPFHGSSSALSMIPLLRYVNFRIAQPRQAIHI